MSNLPSRALRRTTISSRTCHCVQQVRHATLLKRPIRPYTFTQLVVQSDGSTYTQRTTSPKPVLKSTKDTRNHPLWDPSLTKVKNLEDDDAGRLKAFRKKFGRGWDIDAPTADEGGEAGGSGQQAATQDNLLDLISGYSDVSAGKPAKDVKADSKAKGSKK